MMLIFTLSTDSILLHMGTCRQVAMLTTNWHVEIAWYLTIKRVRCYKFQMSGMDIKNCLFKEGEIAIVCDRHMGP